MEAAARSRLQWQCRRGLLEYRVLTHVAVVTEDAQVGFGLCHRL